MSASNLYEASVQWASRPDDERFESLEAMYTATKAFADASRTAVVPLPTLRVEASRSDIRVLGRTNTPATLTHYAFGQLAKAAKAPADYLRRLPATLAAQNLNHGLRVAGDNAPADRLQLLLGTTSNGLTARAVTTDSYDRLWNHEVVSKIGQRLVSEGWRIPPARPAHQNQKGTRPATASDILPRQSDFGLAVKVGDPIAPAGLYASDHDMFAFMVSEDIDVGGDTLLNRGVFISNSEVGDCSLRFKLFVYDNVCGNHICWGVSDVVEVAIRHVKARLATRGNTLVNALAQWSVLSSRQQSAGDLANDIRKAKSYEIATTKADVLDAVFNFANRKGLNLLSKKVIEAGYDTAECNPRYGDPGTVWAAVNGITQHSQTLSNHTDSRVALDTQAGRLMELAF